MKVKGGHSWPPILCEELKVYYQRKVAEGKNPMSVLNAVRFKLICRIFSVIKRNEEFQKEYKKIAA